MLNVNTLILGPDRGHSPEEAKRLEKSLKKEYFVSIFFCIPRRQSPCLLIYCLAVQYTDVAITHLSILASNVWYEMSGNHLGRCPYSTHTRV